MKTIIAFFSMCRAICTKRYPMPWKTFWTALLCLVYFISPIDIFPDVLPVLGITDDITFILLVLAMIKKEIDKYQASRIAPSDKVIDLGDIKDHKK